MITNMFHKNLTAFIRMAVKHELNILTESRPTDYDLRCIHRGTCETNDWVKY